jgi:ATP-dependent Clp protease ATP-binding subunit ClpA
VESSARSYLARKGYDEQFGARPLRRLIEAEIARPLADELLFGSLSKGGEVVISAVDDKLVFAF